MTNETINNVNLSNDLSAGQEPINIKDTLNIPDYDPIKYPMPNEESAVRAYGLMYKMNLLGAGADKNVTSMLLNLYCNINDYLMNNNDQMTNGYASNLIESLNKLKEYCKKTKNPLLK